MDLESELIVDFHAEFARVRWNFIGVNRPASQGVWNGYAVG